MGYLTAKEPQFQRWTMCKLKKYIQLRKEENSTQNAYNIVRDTDIDLIKFQNLIQEVKDPRDAYSVMKAAGFNHLSCIKMLCKIYHLSLNEAKEIMICANTDAKSLSEYQEKYILPALKHAFEEEKRDSIQKKDKQKKPH